MGGHRWAHATQRAGEAMMRSAAPKLRLVRSPEESPVWELDEREPPPVADASPPSGELTLEILYQQYAPYVGAVASRVLGRAIEVDDVVQDVFASAVRGLRRRDDPREIKSWLAKVTVRRCVRQLRSRRLWATVDLAADPSYDRLADPGAGPEEQHLVVEVYRALDGVPARQRVAWTLRHVEGESLDRVAFLCGCSLATAKRWIASAHANLARKLRGGTLA
jgi:RNA polymerase sigma-70 factor (ECF subfamily)